MTKTQTENIELQIVKRLDARIEDVFAAWTNPEQLKSWFGWTQRLEVEPPNAQELSHPQPQFW